MRNLLVIKLKNNMENEENTNQEPQLSKKERADLRRAEKAKTQQQARNARKMKKYATYGGSIAVIVVLLFLGVSAAERANESRPGTQQAGEGQEHVDIATNEHEYQTNPPTSGPHGSAIRFGVYEEEVLDGNAIHNMEHGGIWISYKDINDEELSQLEAIARKAPNSVLLSPRSTNDSRIVVASWQRLMELDVVDIEAIEDYIKRNINRSPEPLAR